MLEIVAGALVAIAALALVLEPLLRSPGQNPAVGGGPDPGEADVTPLEETDDPKLQALLALKEIEFDRATGKLSDEDYAALKAKYSAAAVAAMRAEEERGVRHGAPRPAAAPGEDPVEAAVRRSRDRTAPVCPDCGPRPERRAVFCSRCGRSLVTPGAGPRCWICGAHLPAGAHYCPDCGRGVAA